MVNHCTNKFNGFLKQSDEEAEEAEEALKRDLNHPVKACVILKYGVQLERYWDQ